VAGYHAVDPWARVASVFCVTPHEQPAIPAAVRPVVLRRVTPERSLAIDSSSSAIGRSSSARRGSARGTIRRMPTAAGSFVVTSQPLEAGELDALLGVMRMRFDKTFSGDLVGTSIVLMSGLMNRELGSGGYVAIEKLDVTLGGRRGSFVLQHSSLMDRGRPSQSIRVVPDSGTGELVGLRGELVIDVRDKQHFYTFTYELP
jgi:hypothetical protein